MKQEPGLQFSDHLRRRIYIFLWIMVSVAILGIGLRIVEYIALKFQTEQMAITPVATIKAVHGPAEEEVVLPGNVVGWHEATLFSRTNGYLVNWRVDFGSHVKKDDLLAEVTTPELEASLKQAEAEVRTAQANYHLAKTTATRWLILLKTDSVSKQETDEKVDDAKAKAALLSAAKANRDRLQKLVGFEKIIAPFDGVIMSRSTDIGRLINAGSSGNIPLFRLVQTSPLRIYIRVPEYYATRIKSDMVAELHFGEHPGKIYIASLLDNAQAIDQSSRTLLVQFAINNPFNELLPGSYTEAHLKIPTIKTNVRLPVNTLIFRAQGLQVAVVDGENKALLKSITISRDYGDVVEVSSGINAGESVILNPPDSLFNGQKVKIVSS